MNNFFIVVYDVYDFDKDGLRDSQRSKKHFEENIEIKFTHLEFEGLMLDDDMKVEYFLSVYPDFLVEDYDGDYFYFSFSKDCVQPHCDLMVDMLNETTSTTFDNLVLKLKEELMFGTLKGA